jgi:hypothetical protein
MVKPGGEPAPPRRGKTGTSKRGGDRSTEQARVEEANRVAAVIDLRMSGMKFADIAKRLNYADESGPATAYRRAIAKVVQEPAREALALELLRTEALLEAVWDKAMLGRIGPHQQALNTVAFRAKLLGLNGAVKIDLTSDTAQAEVQEVVDGLLAIMDSREQQ